MILAKFYENNQIYLQEFIEDSVKIEFDIFTFGIATLNIGINNNIKEKQWVELIEVDQILQDNRIFRGFIYSINPIRKQFSKISIVLRSEKALFDELIALSDVTLSWPITNIQTQLLLPYNSYWLSYTLSSDIVTNIETMDIKIWDNYSSLIDNICTQFDVYRDVQDWVVFIKKQLWIDRTNWSNYTEAYFNGSFPSENNIKEIKGWSVSERFNVLVATDGNTKQLISNYAWIFYGARVKEFREGSYTQKSQAYLDQWDKDKRNYIFHIEENSINADIGDIIKVIVQNTNQYYNIDASCMVTKKTIEYNKWKKISYEFQEFPTQTLTTESFNRRVSQQIAYNVIK